MKKKIIYVSIFGSLLIILDSVNASHWLVLLLMAGVIPGTDILISPIDMMAAIATTITVIILRITLWPKLLAYLLQHDEARIKLKKHTPHRTT